MQDECCISLQSLGDMPSPAALAQLLLERQALIDEALFNQDKDALKELINIDKENLHRLRQMLAKHKETLGNLAKLAQYQL